MKDPFASTPYVAELLRAHLLASPGAAQCESSSASGAAAAGVPAGLVDVRHAAPAMVILPAPHWSHPTLRFMVHPELARRLQAAATTLPENLRLGFWEGLRPLGVQRRLWETGFGFLADQNPAWTHTEIEAALEQYVARPDGLTPPHSTGSAVDIAAVDAFGRVLQPNDAWGRFATESMSRALQEAGLANYQPEWWHWSYGDHEWARAFDRAPLPFAVASEFDGPGGGI